MERLKRTCGCKKRGGERESNKKEMERKECKRGERMRVCMKNCKKIWEGEEGTEAINKGLKKDQVERRKEW